MRLFSFKRSSRRFRSSVALLAVISIVGVIGFFIDRLPDVDTLALEAVNDSEAAGGTDNLIAQRFQKAVGLLQSRQFEPALTAFHQVLALAPAMPEAHINIGYTLIGLNNYRAAQRAFLNAIELKPELANAYYGLALTYEHVNDIASALGAMRSYIHLSSPDAPHLTKARSAIWEWESQETR